MGVAGLFRQVLKYNKKTHSHQLAKIINYLLIDFNGIVYKAKPLLDAEWADKKKSYNEKKVHEYEEALIVKVVEYTQNLINNVVNPTTLVYIAVDGPAPRAKMVQQRSRRYKGIKETEFKNQIKKEHDMPVTEGWSASSNMAPGTQFMFNLTNKMKEAIEKHKFSGEEGTRDIVFSSGQVPGEGEHKFMPYIRRMKSSKLLKDKTVCIYSGDGDLIPLSIVSNKNNIYLIKEVDGNLLREHPHYEGKDWIFTNIDEIKKGLNYILEKHLEVNNDINTERFTLDYAFLLSIGGNDFIHGLPFTIVRDRGFEENLLPSYWSTYDTLGKYLLTIKKKDKKIEVNMDFLKMLFQELTQIEDTFMAGYQKRKITRMMEGFIPSRTLDMEAKMTPYEKEVSRFDHYGIHSPHHFLHDTYAEDFMKIDYTKDHDKWKKDYYKFYMGVDPSSVGYKDYINNVCERYLKTLYWSIQYYASGCPSWSFHYGFRVSPMPSDVLNFIIEKGFDLNAVEFDMGKPYTPYQQLMLILPPQMKHIVPKSLGNLMTDPKKLLVPYYPINFRVDATVGLKWMYSEAILPEIDDDFLLDIVKKEEKKLTGLEKEMNRVETKPMRKAAPKGKSTKKVVKKVKKSE